MLRGKLVVLRPVQRSDIKYFLKWFNDPEVIQYLGLYLPMTEMAEEKYIEDLANRASTNVSFVIEAIDGEKTIPIGSVACIKSTLKTTTALSAFPSGRKNTGAKATGRKPRVWYFATGLKN